MEVEKELITEKLMDPELDKLIATTDGLSKHKNVELSIKSRQAGNVLYCQKNHTNEIHKEILNFYSKSIAFAPTASESLALGYFNRSALLLHLKSYHKSLLDIDKSLAITKSNVLKVKLLCRKVDCLIALGSPESADVFSKAVEYHDKIDPKDRDDDHTSEVLTNTKKKLDINKEIEKPSIDQVKEYKFESKYTDFSSVKRKKSRKYGKCLMATRDIQPGEIVYIEKPYVVCSGSEKLYLNCSNCLAIAWNGIPCGNCNWSIYCSEKCRKEAWMNYHFVECPVITHMIELKRSFSQNFQMALRAVIRGFMESRGVNRLKIDIERLLKDKKYLFSMILYNFKRIGGHYYEKDISNTAIALSYAVKYTPLFGKSLSDTEAGNGLANNENVLYIGSLLLKFVQICNKYGYSFSISPNVCKHANKTVRCFKKHCNDKFSYLAPVTTMMNNSCIPNVRRIFTNNSKIIVYALETIYANEQVFESHLCSFYETPTSINRKNILSSKFQFDCDCAACQGNWPTLIEVLKTEEANTVSPLTPSCYLEYPDMEAGLEDEYRELMKEAANLDTECNENTILEFRNAIVKVTKRQPSKIMCRLLFSMGIVFDKIYGVDDKLFKCLP